MEPGAFLEYPAGLPCTGAWVWLGEVGQKGLYMVTEQV